MAIITRNVLKFEDVRNLNMIYIQYDIARQAVADNFLTRFDIEVLPEENTLSYGKVFVVRLDC